MAEDKLTDKLTYLANHLRSRPEQVATLNQATGDTNTKKLHYAVRQLLKQSSCEANNHLVFPPPPPLYHYTQNSVLRSLQELQLKLSEGPNSFSSNSIYGLAPHITNICAKFSPPNPPPALSVLHVTRVVLDNMQTGKGEINTIDERMQSMERNRLRLLKLKINALVGEDVDVDVDVDVDSRSSDVIHGMEQWRKDLLSDDRRNDNDSDWGNSSADGDDEEEEIDADADANAALDSNSNSNSSPNEAEIFDDDIDSAFSNATLRRPILLLPPTTSTATATATATATSTATSSSTTHTVTITESTIVLEAIAMLLGHSPTINHNNSYRTSQLPTSILATLLPWNKDSNLSKNFIVPLTTLRSFVNHTSDNGSRVLSKLVEVSERSVLFGRREYEPLLN